MAFDANDLSPHEQFVVERIRLGEVADFSAMSEPSGAKPSLRAGFLRKLMLELEPDWRVRSPGVRIKGARIEGVLDLTDCLGAGGIGLPALALVSCDIPEPIDVSHARLARFSLQGSRLVSLLADETKIDGELNLCQTAPLGAPGLETLTVKARGVRIGGDFAADGAKFARATLTNDHALFMENAAVAGSVLLDEGFEAFGCVWLAGIRIGGNLECDGGKFLNRIANAGGAALVAENAEIAGDVFLRGGFMAEGEVWFEGARIRGGVDFEDSVMRNEGGDALVLADSDIAGAVSCHGNGGGCKLSGKLRLEGARIGRNLDLRGAEIVDRLTPRSESYGRALDATNVSVGGAALLQGANIKGETLFADARISGYFVLGGARFINPGQWALRAPNARIGGNLTFKIAEDGYAPHGQKTVIEGGAKFDRARIEGAVAWAVLELRGPGPDGSKGAAFSFADAVIAGPLQARALTAQDALIDLSGAACASLDDDLKTGWGADKSAVDLEGFAYARLEGGQDTWATRLAWLRRTRRTRFSPQPYAQLAHVYARAGRREDARRVLLAQHDQRTLRASAGPLTWALSSAFGLIAGYGFAPIRAARALLLFIALGVAGVLAMNAQGALVRPDGSACNGAVEPALYALDVALPVIDLGQESRCAPGRASGALLTQGVQLGAWRLFDARALWQWAHALYALLGAILTALALITFSGMMKPKEE